MRARFFAQNLRRFVNSDVIIGEISNTITLNRYAYANGNPVSNVDPFGLSADKSEEKKNPYEGYEAFVDEQLMFKEIYGDFSAAEIEEAPFQVVIVQ